MAKRKGRTVTKARGKSRAKAATKAKAPAIARAALPEDFHALYDRGARASRGVAPAMAVRPRSAGHTRLAAEVPDLEVDYDQATQLPNRIVTRHPIAHLSRAAATGRSAAQSVTQFVRDRGDLWHLSPADVATVEVVSTSTRGLPTVNLIQRVEGTEVFNSDVTASVGPGNEVTSIAGQLFPGVATGQSRARATAARPTSAAEAIAKAASDLTNLSYEAADFTKAKGGPNDGPYRFYAFKARRGDKRAAFERPVRVKDVLFPLGEGHFVPAYYMELWITGFPLFSYVMDAVDSPDLLYRRNLTSLAAFKYRVHNTGNATFQPEDGPAPGTPHPTGTPNGFQAPTVPQKLIAIESMLPGKPWLPATATTTRGNNCFAYADLSSPDGFSAGDPVGKVTSPKVFNHVYDHSKPASTAKNLQSSLVGMFFHVNWLHDRWYEAGFDEASGNGQQDNFGLGGVGGDPVHAEGNDFSGSDNANMATPADGSSPRMQMYEFLGPTPAKPSRTSNFEALITFHEMGHYITNRLVGNANGLTNLQGKAMGEGWGDFFAVCMTSKITDNFTTGVFAVGGWTDLTPTFAENYYFSIRRYPYSADMQKNPLTFKHIGNNVVLPAGPKRNPSAGGPNNESHNAGEVWCAALWEVFVALVARHGWATAEPRMLSYVVGGLKVTPLRPTFTQARDGIITAVRALHPEDEQQVRAGFAKRGFGRTAVSPPSSSTSLAGVVESFTP